MRRYTNSVFKTHDCRRKARERTRLYIISFIRKMENVARFLAAIIPAADLTKFCCRARRNAMLICACILNSCVCVYMQMQLSKSHCGNIFSHHDY